MSRRRSMYISMELNIVSVRVGLDNAKEVHWSRILGEWSDIYEWL